jgi:hypothetical protein
VSKGRGAAFSVVVSCIAGLRVSRGCCTAQRFDLGTLERSAAQRSAVPSARLPRLSIWTPERESVAWRPGSMAGITKAMEKAAPQISKPQAHPLRVVVEQMPEPDSVSEGQGVERLPNPDQYERMALGGSNSTTTSGRSAAR